MAKLFSFVPGDKKKLHEFFSRNMNGLSPTIHKGYLVATKGKGNTMEMHFVVGNKTATFKRAYAWMRYPDGTVVTEEIGK